MSVPFDTVLVVDWSAANTPSPRRETANAIWIGQAARTGVTSRYFRTRALAEAHLTALIDAERAAGHRIFLGFDFAFGYPAGFARHLTGQAGAAAVWNWYAARITDTDRNANNRFTLANAINAELGGAGPFWGRPASLALPHLAETKQVDYGALGFSERRRVETLVPKAQSVWKLYTVGSVGSQVLMGLPMIARLAGRPDVAVWPFAAPDRPVVLAEIYPSLIDRAVQAAADPVKDRAQVALLSRALWILSQAGTLAPLMADVPDWDGRADEGWILGAGQSATLLGTLA